MWPAAPTVVGVSLKMYFDHERTVQWCRGLRSLVERRHVPAGALELMILPTFVSLPAAAAIFQDTDIGLGAQDLFWEDAGPYTGEVGGPSLLQTGCRYAEIGHAERRRLFHEDTTVFAAKTLAAVRNGLTPIICVGEPEQGPAPQAAERCVAELEQIVAGLVEHHRASRLIIAYEPEWAIGAAQPAPVDHIIEVCATIRTWLRAQPRFATAQVIYGGTAGAGLLTRLAGRADGLFLGRGAHDLTALDAIVGEAVDLADGQPIGTERAGQERARGQG